MSHTLLGVDTGGTFTDFVVLDAELVKTHKVLSTPDAPERAILQGIDELGLDRSRLVVVHGSTVATNAVLEGKGVKVAYVTNSGLKDVLTIGRQNRAELYNLNPAPVTPPVDEALCFEVDTRLSATGELLREVDEAALQGLVQDIQNSGAQAVAINLLFSYLDARQEQRIADALPEGLFVSCSSSVLAEYREYERGIATWINASVGPLMQGYLQRLKKGLAPAPVSVMQSTGGTIDIDQAAQHAVRLLLSGPAGGLIGAKAVAAQAGRQQLLTFDMGGTSTDVALINGELSLSTQGRMGRYPIAVPMVDMHTIGAGGGSLATVDAGGLLQVGPESAGASPGPACYGQGGDQVTVTDANVVLGRLPNLSALGGSLSLDVSAAEQAMGRLAAQLNLSGLQTAQGVLRLANEHMARALRVISVERGVDIEAFTLTCFGGAGGMHVCELAELMKMRRALIPVNSGVLSALGMLLAPAQRETSQTFNQPLLDTAVSQIEAYLADADRLLQQALRAEGQDGELQGHYQVELRYQGQASTLALAWQADLSSLAEEFHRAHKQQFGHRMDIDVELVNVRVQLRGMPPRLHLPTLAENSDAAEALLAHVPVQGEGDIPCYQRERLGAGATITGPAVIVEKVATTWLASGWAAEVDRLGNLILSR